MGKQFTLGSNERVKSRKLIEQLFSEGRTMNTASFRVLYLLQLKAVAATGLPLRRQAPAALQCGFGVSSRLFKKAVDRNRIKRLTREAWRLQKPALAAQMEAGIYQLSVFIIYTGRELPDFNMVKEKVGVILKKLTMITDEKGPQLS